VSGDFLAVGAGGASDPPQPERRINAARDAAV